MLPFKLNDSSFLYDFYCSLWISDHFALIMCVSSFHTIVKWSSSYIVFLLLRCLLLLAFVCLFVCERREIIYFQYREASNDSCYVQTDGPTIFTLSIVFFFYFPQSLSLAAWLLLDTIKLCVFPLLFHYIFFHSRYFLCASSTFCILFCLNRACSLLICFHLIWLFFHFSRMYY